MSENHARQTVAAARIASELHMTQQVAGQLAISSKNVRAIVLRAGSQAAGLAVIANFYDELANKTITLAKSINVTALEISTHSLIKCSFSINVGCHLTGPSKIGFAGCVSLILKSWFRSTDEYSEMKI